MVTGSKRERRSHGTGQNPCGGGPACFLLVGLGFLGAGGQVNAGLNLHSSDLGVTQLLFSLGDPLPAVEVRIGARVRGGASTMNSRPIAGLQI